MELGALTIRMAADLASLKRDMDEAKRSVGGAMAEMQRMADLAKRAFIGLTGVASAAMFVNMIKGAIDASAALHDLSIQTGASVAALGAFKGIGSYTETSIDSITGAMGKLSKSMSTSDEDAKGAAAAIAALGIDFKTLKALSPEDQMLEVAKAMEQFRDGADKSAAAQALFGKEGAKLLPFLADLAGASDEVTAALTEQEKATRAQLAAQSDAFGDNLTQIRKNGEAWKKDLAQGMTPALYELSEAVLKVTNSAGGLKDQIRELSKDGSISEWTRGVINFSTYVIDDLQIIGRLGAQIVDLFETIGSKAAAGLGGTFKGLALAAKGEFSEAAQTFAMAREEVQRLESNYSSNYEQRWGSKLMGQQIREQMSDLKGLQVEVDQTNKKQLNLKATLDAMEAQRKAAEEARKLAAAERKKAEEEAARLEKAGQDELRTILNRNQALQQQVDLGRELTPVEQEQLKLTQLLAAGKITLGQADQELARITIARSAAMERDLAYMKATRAENDAAVAATDRSIEQLQAETEKQREANEAFGRTADQITLLKAARLAEMAVAADKRAQLLDEIDWTGRLGDQQRELAAAYRAASEEATRGASIQAAQRAADEWKKVWDQVGQSLSDALMNGGKSAADYLKGLFRSLVLRPVIQAVVQDSGNWVAQVLGGSSSGGGTSGVGGWMQSGSQAMSLYSAMSSGTGLAGSVGTTVFGNSAAYGAAIGTTNIGAGSQAAMLAAQTGEFGAAGATATSSAAAGAGSGAASSASTLGWIGAIVAGVYKANKDYSEGFRRDQAKDVSKQFGYGVGGYESDLANFYSKLGLSNRWADLLSGSTAVAKIFGRAAPRVSGTGLMGTLGGDDGASLNDYRDVIAKGGLFRRSKRWTDVGGRNDEASDMLGKAVSAVQDQTRAYAEVVGIGSDAISTYTRTIKVQLSGLNAEQQAAALKREVDVYTVELNRLVGAPLAGLAKVGETLDQTLTRVGTTMKSVNAVLKSLGQTALKASVDGAGAASDLADAFGGVANFTSAANQYVQDYYTKAEQSAIQTQVMTDAFAKLGLKLPTSRAELRKLIEQQDLMTQSGRDTYASLIGLSAAFASITQTTDDLTAAQEALAAATQQSASTVIDEIKRLRGTGGTASAAALQAQFATRTAQARAGDLTALQALPEITQALEEAANATATSAADGARLRAWLAGSLTETLHAIGVTVPAFAAGGLHAGGLRLVGERGMELEATGASRIWSAAQTQDMLAGGGSAVADRVQLVEQAVSGMREDLRAGLAQIAGHTGKTARILTRVTQDGDSITTSTAV